MAASCELARAVLLARFGTPDPMTENPFSTQGGVLACRLWSPGAESRGASGSLLNGRTP